MHNLADCELRSSAKSIHCFQIFRAIADTVKSITNGIDEILLRLEVWNSVQMSS